MKTFGVSVHGFLELTMAKATKSARLARMPDRTSRMFADCLLTLSMYSSTLGGKAMVRQAIRTMQM